MPRNVRLNPQRAWAEYVNTHRAMSMARANVYRHATPEQRIELARDGLLEPRTRSAAFAFIEHLPIEERKPLLGALVEHASWPQGDIPAAQQLILAFPRDWLIEHIAPCAEPVLKHATHAEYRALLALYALIGADDPDARKYHVRGVMMMDRETFLAALFGNDTLAALVANRSKALDVAAALFPDLTVAQRHWTAFVDYRGVQGERVTDYRFYLRGRDVELGDMANHMESVIPVEHTALPISQDELGAAQRMFTMLLLASSYRQPGPDSDYPPEHYNRSRQMFANALVFASFSNETAYRIQIAQHVMMAFISFGSETPDNLACVAHVEYGDVPTADGQTVSGFKIKGKPLLLSTIAEQLLAIDLSEALTDDSHWNYGPDEWRITLLAILTVLRSLEQRTTASNDSE